MFAFHSVAMTLGADMAHLHVMQAAEAEVQAVAEQTPKDPGAGFKGKKSKAAAKQGTAKRQWEILRDSGIPESEISEFRWTISLLVVLPATAAGMHSVQLLQSCDMCLPLGQYSPEWLLV